MMTKKYDVFCDACRKVAAVVEIRTDPAGIERSFSVRRAVWDKEAHDIPSPDSIEGIACNLCSKNYCARCWSNSSDIFEDGFFDYTVATCPKGHERIIDD